MAYARHGIALTSLLVLSLLILFVNQRTLSRNPAVVESQMLNSQFEDVPKISLNTNTAAVINDHVHAVSAIEAATTSTTTFISESSIQTSRPTATSKSTDIYKATIVVQLSGEMANNLQHIAHGKGLQWWLQDEYNITTNLILRHHANKWKKARHDVQLCFPNLRSWDFDQGNTDEFIQRRRQQNQWNRNDMDHVQELVNDWHTSNITKGLALFRDLVLRQQYPRVNSDATIEIPFIYSQSLDPFPIIDRYYARLRDLFRFDTASSKCCNQRAEPQQSVFHFRNYQSELGTEKAYRMGFPELHPHQTAHDLFSHHGDLSVAVTARIVNNKARAHVQALKDAGVASVTLIEGQTGLQDFCFLRSAQHELVGNARSTYVLWAGILGNASKIRLYNVNTKGIRERHSDQFLRRFTYNFTAEHVEFELYEEYDDAGR